MHIKLSWLSVLLGLAVALPNFYALAKPASFAAAARRFPRHYAWGCTLMLLGTAWFVNYVRQEQIADFESLKPYLIALFIGVGVGACFFLTDFLAVRGLSVVMMLLAKLMVDTAHLHDSAWRLVIVTWAYVLVFFGMWFTISPWRLRDMIDWATASETRIRVGSAMRGAFGLFVALLGLLVF